MKIGPITPAATAPPCNTPTIDPSDFVPNIMLPNVPRIGMMLPKPTPNKIMKGAAISIELTVASSKLHFYIGLFSGHQDFFLI